MWMARPLRFVPAGWLAHITCRTLHGRLLLRPSRDLNEIVLGILGRAQRRYAMRICAFTVLSNHLHLLLLPSDAEQLALFMAYLNANLAKEAGRLHGWKERLWGRRYTLQLVHPEDAAEQVQRLRYVLEQGCKEGLVRSPCDWPGATSTLALLQGVSLEGVWFDRTAEYEARQRGERPSKYAHTELESVALTPLPCWHDLAKREHRGSVAAIVEDITRQTRQRLADEGRAPLGVKRILAQDPHSKPQHFERSPAPRFHASSRELRRALEAAYREFVLAYRQASQALRTRALGVDFPPGCFPPRSPFIRRQPALGFP
jgi:REP element-mobilizing transposase RayT